MRQFYVPLSQAWATYDPLTGSGPRDYFMRPAGSYRNINSYRESSRRSFIFIVHLRTCRPFFWSLTIFSVENIFFCSSKTFFFALPISATLTIVVVEDIELDPSNHPVREGLHFSTYGPPTKEVAYPCSKS